MNVANLPYLRPRRKDIFSPLPPEVQEIILKNLQLKDVMACCQVSKSWNEIVSTKKQIWKNFCRTSAFNYKMIENEANTRCKEWFLFMKQRVKKAKAEGLQVYNLLPYRPKCKSKFTKIEAFYVYESLIAVATAHNSIQLYKFSESVECVLEIDEAITPPRKIIFLRVDGTVVAAMQDGGSVSAWNIKNGCKIATYIPIRDLICFDLLKNTLIVALGGKGYIQISNISSDKTVKAKTNEEIFILQIVITHENFENQELKSQTILLFCRDRKNIFIFKMDNSSSTLNPEIGSVTHLHTIIPPQFSVLPCFSCLCYDGSKYVYYNHDSKGKQSGTMITKLDVVTGQTMEIMTLPPSILACRIFGVGREILLFMGKEFPCTEIIIYAATSSLKKYCVIFRIPCEIPGYSFEETSFIGEKKWLNGLDESNDRGLVFGHIASRKVIYLASLPQDKKIFSF